VRYLDHLGAEFHAYRAWALFVLEHWLRTHPAAPEMRPFRFARDKRETIDRRQVERETRAGDGSREIVGDRR
jgi:hypothetical protein